MKKEMIVFLAWSFAAPYTLRIDWLVRKHSKTTKEKRLTLLKLSLHTAYLYFSSYHIQIPINEYNSMFVYRFAEYPNVCSAQGTYQILCRELLGELNRSKRN